MGGSPPSIMWQIAPDSIPANRKIILGSPKGGCGKSSLEMLAASELARMGAKVLFIEITEGQAPLTQSFAHSTLDTGVGIGVHLQRLIGLARGGETHSQTMTRLKPAALREAQDLKASGAMVRIGVSPKDPSLGFDFLPCGESALAELATSPKMQERGVRRGVFGALLEALAEVYDGGWDFILMDILPSAESVIVRGAMGVTDSYALVVDMESAQPLPGWGVLMGELVQITEARTHEGLDPNLFKGLILNKVKPDRPGLTRKVNTLKVRMRQAQAEAEGVHVPVLAEVRNMTTLALLGFNTLAVQQLAAHYGGTIPNDLDDLNEEDVSRLTLFEEGRDEHGQGLPVVTGAAYLAKLFPPLRTILDTETRDLHPLLLNLAGDQEALDALLEAYQASASEPEAMEA
jgi:cellulose biosynthesis protein BcsQ